MEKPKGSGYKIQNIILIESTFHRKVDINFDGTPFENQIDIQKDSYDIENEENKFGVNLTIVFDAHQHGEVSFQIKVKMAGLFEKQGETALPTENFKEINAPAIIYPFIREHVSSLTLKAGIGNVLLPSVNFKI